MIRVRKRQYTIPRRRKQRLRYRLEAQSKWCSGWFMIIQQEGLIRAGFNGRCIWTWKRNGKTTTSLLSRDSVFPKTETNRRGLLWRQNRNRQTLNKRKHTVTTSVGTLWRTRLETDDGQKTLRNEQHQLTAIWYFFDRAS